MQPRQVALDYTRQMSNSLGDRNCTDLGGGGVHPTAQPGVDNIK